MSTEDLEFMDIDGPEFLNDVHHQIANIRADQNYEYLDIPMIVPDQLSLQPRKKKNLQHTENDSENNPILFSFLTGLSDSFSEIAVLDTNFLLSRLGYLDVLLTLADENPSNLLVILPWVVIRELDGLKNSGNDSDVRASARKAMRFLELHLRDKSASLRGQKMNEVSNQAINHSRDVKGDDRILDCCIYFQQLTQRRILLLSNDRNLCIKVMVHEIDSVSAESVDRMEALLNRVAGKSGTILDSKYSHTVKKKHRKRHNRQQQQQQEQQYHNQLTEDYSMDIDDTYSEQFAYNTMDTSMMIDDDHMHSIFLSTQESQWAKAPKRFYGKKSEPPAYLDDDPTLVAPKRPYRPQHGVYK